MEKIIEYLRASVADQFLSKTEKRMLKDLLAQQPITAHDLNFLRSKVYEVANAHATPENYRFILEWIKNTNSVLLSAPAEVKMDSYFSPGEECLNVINHQILTARQQLLICVFTISDDRITNTLLKAHERGIRVRVITDNDKSMDEGSDIEKLAAAGIAVKMDTSPNHMHHKFMVADQQALLTGSYNWTRSAARFNHENIILTHDAGTVRAFAAEFEKLWPTMEEYR